jgi:alanyl-tRNA synthetase
LYFTDAYLTSFSARIVARGERDGRPTVTLDRSAFYPQGGGQPADTGTLSGVAVLDVQSTEDGAVWHTLASPLATELVDGVVEWTRRFDHMQQHHGQHLLSAAFEELCQSRTVAFHLGVEYASIDLSGDVSEAQLLAAEERTNQVIWEDRPVHARFVSPEELATLALRKPPTVAGAIRVVSVERFDHSACGGTHPRSTGAVGLLYARRREKRGADTRVEFICGGRALRDLRNKGSLVSRLAGRLTVGVDELDEAVGRLREREEVAHKRLTTVMDALLAHEARDLVAAAKESGGTPLVHLVRSDLTLDEARSLARAVVAHGAVIVLGIAGEKSQLLVGRPASDTLDCGKVVREAVTPFGGRGGGQPGMAQGGVPEGGKLAEVVAAAVALIQRETHNPLLD